MDTELSTTQACALPKNKDTGKARAIYAVLLTLVFLILTLPLVNKQSLDKLTTEGRDEFYYHYPTIRMMAEQLPEPDLSNYPSATTPLYHLLMASAMKTGIGLTGLRYLNLLISLLCVLAVYAYLLRRGEASKAFAFSLMFMLSFYFIGASVRLMTDNPAWLLIVLTLLVSERQSMCIPRSLRLPGVLAALALVTRQSCAWLAAANAYKAFADTKAGFSVKIRNGALSLLPLMALLPFIILWHGLAPPSAALKHQVSTGNIGNMLSVFVYSFSVLGFFGVFFLPSVLRMVSEHRSRLRHIVGIWGICAVLLMVSPVSPAKLAAESAAAGKFPPSGPLLHMSRHFPEFCGTPVLLWLTFLLGACIFYLGWVHSLKKGTPYLMVCATLWQAAAMMNVHVYQKYYEPWWLLFIGVLMIEAGFRRWYDWTGFGLLILMKLALYVLYFIMAGSLFSAPPA